MLAADRVGDTLNDERHQLTGLQRRTQAPPGNVHTDSKRATAPLAGEIQARPAGGWKRVDREGIGKEFQPG